MPTKTIRANDKCEYCFTCLNQPGGKSRHFAGCAVGCYSAHRRIHGEDHEELNRTNMLDVIRKRPNWRRELRLYETKLHPLKQVPIHYFSFPSDSNSDSEAESDSDSDSDTERTTAPAPPQSNEEGLREAMLRVMPAAKKVEMFRLMSDEDREAMLRVMPAEQAKEMFAFMSQ